MHDPFASSTPAAILSWIVAIPAFYVIFGHIVFLFKQREGVGRSLSIWIGICFLILGPIRYIFFQFLLFAEYPFQSFRAFSSIFGVGILGPVGLTLLYVLGFLLPLFAIYKIAHVDTRAIPRNTLAAVFLAPVMAIVGSFIFSFLSPVAQKTTRNMNAEGLIRATNGPTRLAYCCAPSWLVSLPKYLELTPGSLTDHVRAHVASVYLNPTEESTYMKNAYPWLMDDDRLQATLGVKFDYKSDGTPTLSPQSQAALSQQAAQGGLSDSQQHAYNILAARGFVGGGADGGGGGGGSAVPMSIDAIQARASRANCH